MYSNPAFEVKDLQTIRAFMEAHPFVMLIGYDGTHPVATQIPVQLVDRGGQLILVGHIMKKTDHYRAFQQNPNILVVFNGAQAYVSASVYENPAVASTWNYQTVQVKGKLSLLDEAQTYEVIRKLTDQYESPEHSPAAFKHIPEDYIKSNLKAISGIEIEVTTIEAIYKLSQNHPHSNQKQIINHLSASDIPDNQQLAAEMKKLTQE